MDFFSEFMVDRWGRFIGRLEYRNGCSEFVEIVGVDEKGIYYYRRLSF